MLPPLLQMLRVTSPLLLAGVRNADAPNLPQTQRGKRQGNESGSIFNLPGKMKAASVLTE
ncbi:UNVERIFIED_CONTAM: hypothetical protein HHA_265175 [Hammondia hammondi]|eukprot:XP_008887208.1 hypothetical protein HHA_265175 [Hammondia hammondi]